MPQLLREKARLTSDVLVIGKGKYLEVVNREDYEAEMNSSEITEEDAAALASFNL